MWDLVGIQSPAHARRRSRCGERGGRFYQDGQVFIPVEETYRPVEIPSGWTILGNINR